MTSRSSCVIRHGKFGCSTSEMGLGRSLIPGHSWQSASPDHPQNGRAKNSPRTRPGGEIRCEVNGLGREPGPRRRGPVRDRGQGRPLGPMPCARPAGGAQAGAALLPRRRVTAQQRPGTALCCAVTSGVEAGNGVADEEAERLGGASRIGRRAISAIARLMAGGGADGGLGPNCALHVCRTAGHHLRATEGKPRRAMALVPLIIRWGAETSSDRLRQCARTLGRSRRRACR
jgi:hypothetical protein